jgi:hypothetical protein
VRFWHREERLRPNNRFTWSFWIDGRPSGGIRVHVQADSVILKFGLRDRNAAADSAVVGV